MATQFMYSAPPGPYGGVQGPYAYPQGVNSYQNSYPTKGTNGKSFAFRKRYEKVDWRRIASVDADQIARTLDFNALQDNIMNITFCNIEAELDLRMVDPNFVKLFKLAQLTIEYLLHSQEYLTGVISTSEEKMKKVQEENNESKGVIEKLKQEIAEVKKESHKRKKLLMAQQQLIHAGSGSYNKCPFCPKAFLNNSFLQSHMNRRHGDFSGKAASVAVGDNVNQDLLEELREIKQRLQSTEKQLQKEKLKTSSKEFILDKQVIEKRVDNKEEIEKVKEMFMKELQDVNEKYQSSERALTEMEVNYGKRSNLGELQDDIDVEKELLRHQREEVAVLKEQLQAKFENVETDMSTRYTKQERKYQRKMQQMNQMHTEDLKKMTDALEKALKSKQQSGTASKQEMQEVENLLRKSKEQEELMLQMEKAPTYAEVVKGENATKIMTMEPLDDDEDTTELGTGTGSLLTGRQSLHSTLGNSGELTLRTTQFLEELRKNPTLKIMRDELESLLQDHLDKIGIPPEQKMRNFLKTPFPNNTKATQGIPDDILHSKLGLLKKRRQTTVLKYPIFPEFRKQCNAYAEQTAREKLKEMKKSPHLPTGYGNRSLPNRPINQGSNLSMVSAGTPSNIRAAPQTAAVRQQQVPPQQRKPVQSQPPPPKPAPRTASPHQQKTMQSTGSSVDWTSTQWESDEDDETDEDDQPAFKPAVNVRMIQSSPKKNVTPSPRPRTTSPEHPSAPPRSQPGQVRTVISKPLNTKDDDDEDDWDDDSELDLGPAKASTMPTASPSRGPISVQPKGQKVAQLSRTIESQLAGRKDLKKPAGAVDTMGSGTPAKNKKKSDILDDFSDSDWDVSPFEDDPPKSRQAPRKAPTPVRSSHASDTSNTYGTSVWGSSSKGASTVPPATTGRGSFVSVTDVSSDEDLDLDNI